MITIALGILLAIVAFIAAIMVIGVLGNLMLLCAWPLVTLLDYLDHKLHPSR